MEIVKKKLFSQEDELKLGMYCHLFLDYYFIEHYLIPSFILDLENNKIINPRNNKYWTIDDFFSENSMYGSYTEINQLLLKDGYVSLDTLESIPEILPLTKIDVFDTRRTRTWKEELVEYMKENKSYTGDVFDYEHFCCFVNKIADKFVDEFK